MHSQFWGPRLYALDKNVTLSILIEHNDSGLFSHGSPSAYPPDRSQALFPSIFSLQWIDASLDDTMVSALRQMSDAVRAAAVADGQNVSHVAIYPNHALFGTPLMDIYGGNVRKIRTMIDPNDVMGPTGGWKF